MKASDESKEKMSRRKVEIAYVSSPGTKIGKELTRSKVRALYTPVIFAA